MVSRKYKLKPGQIAVTPPITTPYLDQLRQLLGKTMQKVNILVYSIKSTIAFNYTFTILMTEFNIALIIYNFITRMSPWLLT